MGVYIYEYIRQQAGGTKPRKLGLKYYSQTPPPLTREQNTGGGGGGGVGGVDGGETHFYSLSGQIIQVFTTSTQHNKQIHTLTTTQNMVSNLLC